LQSAAFVSAGDLVAGTDAAGRKVSAAASTIAGPDWTVIVAQPNSEAFYRLRATLWRIGALLLAGTALAASLAYWLARRMTGPIKLLEQGAERIGSGHFDHQIEVHTGDELEVLAGRFNEMAVELALSQERSERIGRLKRFLSPQVAELLDSKGHESLLASHRGEVAVVFCDLRGFTAFSSIATPEVVMGLLGQYHQALGKIIVAYEATLTCYMGDGLMLLLNAPLPCVASAMKATRMAVEMQATVQTLILNWRAEGHTIGFGVGVATGEATVGRIGYEGRIDYTAIGRVVNLASRLCSSASDGQVIIDSATADALTEELVIEPLGAKSMKGFPEPVLVYSVKVNFVHGSTAS